MSATNAPLVCVTVTLLCWLVLLLAGNVQTQSSTLEVQAFAGGHDTLIAMLMATPQVPAGMCENLPRQGHVRCPTRRRGIEHRQA
jgi:hypothetical protein